MKDSEIKVCIQLLHKYCVKSALQELKEAYFTELSASKATAESFKTVDSKPAGQRPKPLVKKRVEEDLFASDDEADSPKNGKLADTDKKRKVPSDSGNVSPIKKKKAL